MRAEPQRDENGCLIWQACVGGNGYGQLRVNGRLVYAHRHAWEQAFGPVPDGLHVLHRCDVRRCVEPSHLFLGTNQDNIADKLQKNRGSRGENHNMAKLSAAQVSDIRKRLAAGDESQAEIAASHGVSQPLVSMIHTGKVWK